MAAEFAGSRRTHVPSIPEPCRRRMGAMLRFLEDCPQGKAEGGYADVSLPDLPFDGGAFDLALSSHFLFLWTPQHDPAFPAYLLQDFSQKTTLNRLK